MVSKGKVFIVGAGPGDVGLLTLRALEVIKSADVILYDRLVSKDILALAVNAEKVYVGREVRDDYKHQEYTNKLMLDYALKGKKVVRLKGGDPFIFGRGGEEAEFLADNGIEFEIVPGVTSAIAAPAYAGIPLTHRALSSSVAIVTGHEDPYKQEHRVNIAKIASSVDTLVILMGISNIKSIVDELLASKIEKDREVAIIENATTPEQRVTIARLEDIVRLVEERNVRPPAVIVIGKVVSLAGKLNWYNKKVNNHG
jgi:uroporphyrin-III C-methyltransferase